ncbi:RNA 2',3'-cyclic phosphodiesterase [Wenzhouxiangella sediminis]|uniref:RNA 2',3'-cyclic phosphodiesterase n=1 Tax=Wenzhouxiangella sediminis TaxID=1792836 RepID=A0A3E1KCW6_9GAMM|nr:RNA 2',3'-cyclic phosphodiesterase [Wenzhouxiangella sediminis]RFF32884.1 RNA 2',3'-cyclic phosphodiesterase [Wenzhouxiangella sediminis]
MPEATRRLFFALWPDDRVRRDIIERREALGRVSRRRVPDHNLHLTLVFLGDQPGERLAAFEEVAGKIEQGACTLELDRFGWFPRARVAWLGGDAPEALGELQGVLWRRMVGLGVRLDERPFRPHVTLFRQVLRRPRMPVPEPLIWPIGDFVLVESIPGSPYRVLRRWALKA